MRPSRRKGKPGMAKPGMASRGPRAGHISVIQNCDKPAFGLIWMLMQSLFDQVSRKGVAICLTGAAAALSFVLAMGPASAAPGEQCPRGQIFWKSKKSCIDKADAAKLGFYHGPLPAAAPAQAPAEPEAHKAAEAPAEAPAETPVTQPPAKAPPGKMPAAPKKAAVEPQAAPAASPPSTPAAALPAFIPPSRMPEVASPQAPASPSQSASAPPGPSPYGELVTEGFSKPRGPDGAISN
jgi:hypothetical protein